MEQFRGLDEDLVVKDVLIKAEIEEMKNGVLLWLAEVSGIEVTLPDQSWNIGGVQIDRPSEVLALVENRLDKKQLLFLLKSAGLDDLGVILCLLKGRDGVWQKQLLSLENDVFGSVSVKLPIDRLRRRYLKRSVNLTFDENGEWLGDWRLTMARRLGKTGLSEDKRFYRTLAGKIGKRPVVRLFDAIF